MAIDISSELYNEVAGLKANVGDWVDGTLDFAITVEHKFDTTNKMFYSDTTGNNGGIFELEWSQGDWSAEGFSAGDDIEIELILKRTCGGFDTTDSVVKYIATISYIDSDTKKIILTGPLLLAPGADTRFPPIPLATFISKHEFPGTGGLSSATCTGSASLGYTYNFGSVRKITRPQEIEFLFNLTSNNSTAQASVLNGQVNRFKHVLPTTPNFSAQIMDISINESGGYFRNVTIKQTADLGATTKWQISYQFMQWGLVEDGFSEPDYFDSADCLAPIGLIRAYAKLGDPNGVLEAQTSNNVGNTGGYDENYNGGANSFIRKSIQWFDSLGNLINGLDYSGPSTFEAVVETGIAQTAAHRYRMGLAFRPEDSDVWTNSRLSAGNNLSINAPLQNFLPDGIVDATAYIGKVNNDGAGFDFSDIKISIVGTTLVISGKVTPTAASISYFSTIPDGGRRTTLWISLGTVATTFGGVPSVPVQGRVSLKLFDSDNIDAPIIGVQIPNVLSEDLFDHDLNPISNNSVDNTTTEDDVLYTSEFLLPENTPFSGMRARISAFNSVTQEEFILESFFIDFSNVVDQAGVLQIDEVLPRNFNLPPTTDRNEISIKRKASLDTSGFAGYEIRYGFLNDWRYWLLQGNVNSFFFDSSEDHKGFNKNWQRFSSGDWNLRLSYFTELVGVEDFNHYVFKIRPYEDDADVTESTVLTVLSNGSNPSELVKNEKIEVEATFTWNQSFADEWVEFTVEDYESGNRWVISSVLDQGNIGANPFKPIAGQTKIDLSLPAVNVLVAKAILDTSLINAKKVSLSYRVYSAPNNSGTIPVNAKLKEDGTVKLKEDGTIKLLE